MSGSRALVDDFTSLATRLDGYTLMKLVSIAFLVAALVVVQAVAFIKRMGMLLRLPRPATTSLLIGNKELLTRQAHHFFEKWLHELGGIMLVRYLFFTHVIVSDPNIADQVMQASPADGLERDDNYGVFDMANPDPHHSTMFTAKSGNPYWKSARKVMLPAFGMRQMRDGFPRMLEIANNMAAELASRALQGDVEITRPLKLAVADTIGSLLFGIDFAGVAKWRWGGKKEDYMWWIDAVEGCLEEMTKGIVSPLRSLFIWNPELKKAKAGFATLSNNSMRLARTVRQRETPSPETCLADALAQMRRPTTQALVTDEVLGAELTNLLITGTEAVALTITWTLFLVSQNPHVEAKIVAELASHGLLATRGNPTPRDLTYDDLTKLTYLGYVFKESMRLKPTGTITTGKITTRDIVLGGKYHIPRGTGVMVLAAGTHKDPLLWERAAEFDPERWAEADAEYCTNSTSACTGARAGKAAGHALNEKMGDVGSRGARRYFPFSFGHRSCVAQNMGKMEVPAFLAVLFGRLSFRLADEMGGAKGVEAREEAWFSLTPGNYLRFQCIPRHVGPT